MGTFNVSLKTLTDRVSMEVVYTPKELDQICVEIAEVNRPGLFLAGYYDYFDKLRLQIMGLAEMNFLSGLSPEKRYEALDQLFRQQPPAVIVCRSEELTPFPEMQELAQKHGVALLRSNETTCTLMGSLISVLNLELAPRITRHGVLVDVYGEGILILGDSGMDGMIELATMLESEILVTAIVGMIGIRPTVAAMKAGKDIALANKETLVTAGHIIMPLAEECGVQILPVDSEHSAIFQCLHGENRKEIEKLLITASGGPFRGKTSAELENVTVEQALRHPNWSMGHKITIDSATLVNKGLEVMEAKWLFGVDLDHIQVVVQPKSIIHSMVEFKDGAVMAQLGTPDMKLPIQYALYYPERRFLAGDRLDFAALTQIPFEKPDMDTFLGLPMAMKASRTGGSMPTVFNAANERAVALFLAKKIRFLEIYDVIAGAMEAHKTIADPTLEQILAAEQETYEWIANRYKMGE